MWKFCDRVIAGQDQPAEVYAAHALADPLAEWESSPRFHHAANLLDVATNVLDVACGNGAFAIGLLKAYPAMRVVGVDYAEGNIAVTPVHFDLTSRSSLEELARFDLNAFVGQTGQTGGATEPEIATSLD